MAYARGLVNIDNATRFQAFLVFWLNNILYVALVVFIGFLLHIGWELY